MNLYLLSQEEEKGYDTYDSCVVVAKSPKEAVKIHPNGDIYDAKNVICSQWSFNNYSGCWVKDPKKVKCTLIGVANRNQKENTVVCASFNAG